MFEDQQSANEQIFTDASPETSATGPSALEAGKLTPAAPVQPMQQMSAKIAATPAQMPVTPIAMSNVAEPKWLKRILIGATVLVALGGVGFGVWWFVMRSAGKTASAITASPSAPATASPATPSASPAQPSSEAPVINIDVQGPSQSATTTATTTELKPPVPEPAKDSDHDGLSDAEESKFGTDETNPDTDADGLTDGSEVNTWQTDPLNKDTDADGFLDGQEVFNGYNPRGAGKLY